MSLHDQSRRSVLKAGGMLGLGLGVMSFTRRAAAACGLATPQQAEGPFYPVRRRLDENYDLTQVEGRADRALGDVIIVKGRVVDMQCQPIAGALVEIWQTCASGRYDHPDDDNPAALDPNFQYWARVQTNAAGEYLFKTIKPGLYPGRTRHIHFRVIAPGHPTLTTQLYFEGEARNASDGIYRSLTTTQRRLVTTGLPVDAESGLPTGSFEITVGWGRNRTPDLD